MTRLLVSVGSPEEAELALASGADLIDAKDPAAGALGALSVATVAAIRRTIGIRAAVTAVAGDHATAPDALAAAETIAATGVDMVKVGFFPAIDATALIAALADRLADETQLVAVLFADRQPDLTLLPKLAKAGFAGVMLDTVEKSGGLRRAMTDSALRDFVALARQHHLMSGLAGSLRIDDLPALQPLGADILGMRGGLCDGDDRTLPLRAERITAAAQALKHGRRLAAE